MIFFRRVNKILFVSSLLLLSGELLWGYQAIRLAPQNPAVSVHYSFYSDKTFFDRAFETVSKTPVKKVDGKILGILINHHLLAPHFIAQAFTAAATTSPVTVVLLSPNHFGVGSGQVLTSRYSWQTPYGELKPDFELIDKLVRSGQVAVDEKPFEKEHGISNVVAFVKRSLPNAKVVPIIVKDTLSPNRADKLAELLATATPENSVIAGSFDFSHYQTLEVANQHDQASLAVVQSLNWQATEDLDIDSRPGLRIFLQLLHKKGAKRFTLLKHSNSALITGNLSAPETTSYITGYFTPLENDVMQSK